MLPYYIITALLLIAGVVSLDQKTRKYDFVVLLFLCVIVTIFSGCRACGWDYDSYLAHFKSLPDILNFSRTQNMMEAGYEVFASFCKSVFHNYNAFLFIFAAINVFVIGCLCRKYSPNPVLSFVLFCGFSLFGQLMGQMRQPQAICLTYLITLPLLIRNMRWRVAIWTIVIGVLLHKSSLLMAILLPFANIRYSDKTCAIAAIVCIVSVVTSSMLTNLLYIVVPKGFYLYDTMVAYMTYLSQKVSFTFGMLERVGLLVLCWYYGRKYKLYDRDIFFRIMMNLFAMGVLIYFSFMQIAPEFASRGTKGLYFCIIFILPILIKNAKRRDKSFLSIFTILWISYLYITFLINPPELYNPYLSVLD